MVPASSMSFQGIFVFITHMCISSTLFLFLSLNTKIRYNTHCLTGSYFPLTTEAIASVPCRQVCLFLVALWIQYGLLKN